MQSVRVKTTSTKRLRCGVQTAPYRLSGVDLLPTHAGMPMVWVFPNGFDQERFEASLIRTLAKYPELAGRLRADAQGVVHLDACDAGVDVHVRACAGELPAFGHDRPMDAALSRFATRVYPWRVVDRDTPLLGVEVSRFDDGGVVLCVTLMHSVWDGAAFFRFVHEWSRACRGMEPEGPASEHEVLIELGTQHAREPYRGDLVYEPGFLERLSLYTRFVVQNVTTIRKGVFRIPAERIEAWKADGASRLPPGEHVGTVDLVTAYCLGAISPVMRSSAERRVAVVTDLRHESRLGIPRAFLGNALAQRQVTYGASELADERPIAVARKLRLACTRDATDELRAYLGFIERRRAEGTLSKLMMRTVAATLDAGILVNNYRAFPIYEVDFGTGRPSWFDNSRVVYRALKVISTPAMDGGVDVHLTAPKKELAAARAAFG